MAAELHTLKSIVRAHNIKVNGVSSYAPCLDDASALLRQAHGSLAVATRAVEDDALNHDIIRAALDAAQTLMEIGLRLLEEGHEELLRDRRAMRRAN